MTNPPSTRTNPSGGQPAAAGARVENPIDTGFSTRRGLNPPEGSRRVQNPVFTGDSNPPKLHPPTGGGNPPLPLCPRDPDREQRFLADAARGHHPLIDHATERLDAGERLYGDRWATVGIRSLIAEMLEEAADQALDGEPVTGEQRQQVRAVLILAARRGTQAHEALCNALRTLDGGEG